MSSTQPVSPTKASLKESSLNFTEKHSVEHKEQSKQSSHSKTKFINSFRRFKLKPDNKEYYIALTRALRSKHFRVAVIDKNECWISQENTFQDIKNKSYSINNQQQFRSHIINSLSSSSNEEYEIEEKNIYSPKDKTMIKSKELKIMRKAGDLKIIMANIRVFKSKYKAKNMDYIFGKISETLIYKQHENEKLIRDNFKFQQKYNQSITIVDEAIAAKNNQEHELLSKFVLILNEKKKTIRALQNEIQRLKNSNTNSNRFNNNFNQTRNKNKNKNKQKSKNKAISIEPQEETKNSQGNDDELDIPIINIANKNKKEKAIDIDIVMLNESNDDDNAEDYNDIDPSLSLHYDEFDNVHNIDNMEELNLSIAELEHPSPSRNNKRNKNKNKNRSKRKKKLNVIDDGSLCIGDIDNKNVSKLSGKKRTRNVMMEYEQIALPQSPEKKKQKKTRNKSAGSTQKRKKRQSNTSDVSDDLHTDSIDKWLQ